MAAPPVALRDLLERRFPDALPVTRHVPSVATGIAALDGILPGGGLPRGRLTAWLPEGGATAVLRAACDAVITSGERAAWVDGGATMFSVSWAQGRGDTLPVLVRPATRVAALRAAEALLRSGAFALVVLTGAPPEGTQAVRLSREARDGGGALVVLTERSAMAGLKLASRILVDRYRWRSSPFGDPAEAQDVVVRVRARALGWDAQTELRVPVAQYDLRLSLEPGLADRRGLPR